MNLKVDMLFYPYEERNKNNKLNKLKIKNSEIYHRKEVMEKTIVSKAREAGRHRGSHLMRRGCCQSQKSVRTLKVIEKLLGVSEGWLQLKPLRAILVEAKQTYFCFTSRIPNSFSQ